MVMLRNFDTADAYKMRILLRWNDTREMRTKESSYLEGWNQCRMRVWRLYKNVCLYWGQHRFSCLVPRAMRRYYASLFLFGRTDNGKEFIKQSISKDTAWQKNVKIGVGPIDNALSENFGLWMFCETCCWPIFTYIMHVLKGTDVVCRSLFKHLLIFVCT